MINDQVVSIFRYKNKIKINNLTIKYKRSKTFSKSRSILYTQKSLSSIINLLVY